MRLFALSIGICIVGCSQAPQARNITGPDGSPMVHVSCGSDQSVCFELAGRNCPTGYNLFPIFDEHDNNFLVRCQTRGTAQSNALLAAPLMPPQPAPAPLAPQASPPATAYSGMSAQSGPPATHATVPDSATDFGY